MELKNLTDLAEKLKSIGDDTEVGFDMCHAYASRHSTNHPCGSACCVAGWVQFCNPNTRTMKLAEAVQTIAPDVAFDELDLLCFPLEYSPAWRATPKQAARAVEILRDTGKCDWNEAMLEGAQ
jgi:hypothetical protein